MEDNQSKQSQGELISVLKMRGSFLPIYKAIRLVLRGSTLEIQKVSPPHSVEKSYELNESTEVERIDEQRKCRFSVKFDEQNLLFFQADTEMEANQWVNVLRGCVFPVDSLSPRRFVVISVIGRGYYGKVLLVRDLITKELCAVKTIHKSRLTDASKVSTIITERDIMLKANHPFIVRLNFAFQTDTKFYLGMEFAPGGELFRLMTTIDVIPINDARIYTAELSLALEYLHSIGVVYRDIKPENILLDKEGHLKLTDFGLAKEIVTDTQTFCGTIDYASPEMVRHEAYGFAVDWWALGVIVYEMLIGETPFADENQNEIYRKILNDTPEFPEDFPEDAADFILRLLDKNQQTRMTFEELQNHPFMGGLDFDAVLRKEIAPEYIPKASDLNAISNFDSDFTGEVPIDSVIKTDATDMTVSGFSYSATNYEPLEEPPQDTDLAPSEI